MKCKILLAVPEKGNAPRELEKILQKERADLFVFPEGFLNSENLDEVLKLTAAAKAYVIAGYKELLEDGRKREKTVVIDAGKVTDSYAKCVLTKSEREKGKIPGERVFCLETKFGKIGTPICYEIHFPEVSRRMAAENPALLLNPVGTGMYHELQYGQWTALARARAIENEVFVLGCSHFTGELPLAYAYDPSGRVLLERKKEYGAFPVEIDLEEGLRKPLGYGRDNPWKYRKGDDCNGAGSDFIEIGRGGPEGPEPPGL